MANQTVDLNEMTTKFESFIKTHINMAKWGLIDTRVAGAHITGYFDSMHDMLPMNDKMYDLLDLSNDALYGDRLQQEIALKYFK